MNRPSGVRMEGLNTEQQAAVTAKNGPVLIIAGPGTGKTKTLTARIVYALTQRGVTPDDIVALTFTHKAAREMSDRLRALLPDEPLPTVTTFHGLGLRLLQDRGIDQPLITPAERHELIAALRKPQQFKGVSAYTVSLLISQRKTALHTTVDESERMLLAAYEQALRGRGKIDYDDLLVQAYQLLKAGDARRYAHVLVDEFQDTSELQYAFLKLLTSRQNIFAIGDPNQAIYAFRGAGAAMFQSFQRDFPHASVISLTRNYRSASAIIAAANAVFPHSPHLSPEMRGPGRARAVQTLDGYSEARYVVRAIEQGIGGSDLLNATHEENVREPSEYAVLYRTHRAGRLVQEAFATSSLPFQVAGEGSPYDRPDIQQIIALLRFLCAPAHVALPKLSQLNERQTRDVIWRLTASNKQQPMNVCEYVPYITEQLGLTYDRHIQQLQGMLVQFGRSIDAALRHIDDIAENEFYDPSINAVSLMTIHAAKGLEFSHVFLVGAEEGILPKLAGSNDAIDEEQRLFYVALTRAKHVFECMYTKTRDRKPAVVSRFVTALPPTILPLEADPAMHLLEKRMKKRAAKRAQSSLF